MCVCSLQIFWWEISKLYLLLKLASGEDQYHRQKSISNTKSRQKSWEKLMVAEPYNPKRWQGIKRRVSLALNTCKKLVKIGVRNWLLPITEARGHFNLVLCVLNSLAHLGKRISIVNFAVLCLAPNLFDVVTTTQVVLVVSLLFNMHTTTPVQR